jgi:hypothetical protein
MIYLHTELAPIGPLVVAVKPKAKEYVCTAAMLQFTSYKKQQEVLGRTNRLFSLVRHGPH